MFRSEVAHVKLGLDCMHACHSVGVGQLTPLSTSSKINSLHNKPYQAKTHLSTSLIRNPFLLAVLVGQSCSSYTKPGLQRARRVVDPTVDDPTVVPTLVYSWQDAEIDKQQSLFITETLMLIGFIQFLTQFL